MPFIIETFAPPTEREDGTVKTTEQGMMHRTSSRAVADLDDARAAAWKAAGWDADTDDHVHELRRAHDGFKEATGGEILLPDGTTVVVKVETFDVWHESSYGAQPEEPLTWWATGDSREDSAPILGPFPTHADAERAAIDSYNVAQEG